MRAIHQVLRKEEEAYWKEPSGRASCRGLTSRFRGKIDGDDDGLAVSQQAARFGDNPSQLFAYRYRLGNSGLKVECRRRSKKRSEKVHV